MSNIANILTHLQIVKEISSFPDEAILSAELAAIFLGVSTKTLASLRQAGDGPAYTQYPKSGSKARNQRVNYIFGDLRKWRDKHVVESTMDAAVKRGLAFLSISDLITPQPFWLVKGQVNNHVFCSTVEQFRENLYNTEASIEFMTWKIALATPWHNNQTRETFLNSYIKFLSGLIDAVK
jgi:hypothetical protein